MPKHQFRLANLDLSQGIDLSGVIELLLADLWRSLVCFYHALLVLSVHEIILSLLISN